MSMNDLKRRLGAAEAAIPKAIVLKLKDGREFRHPGPVLDFYMEGLEAARKGRGPFFNALRTTVSATGCGNIWQVLLIAAAGPIDVGGRPTPPPKQEETRRTHENKRTR
jgi:hypothetical protein